MLLMPREQTDIALYHRNEIVRDIYTMNLENHRYVEQTVPKQMRRLSYPTFACVQELKVKSGDYGRRQRTYRTYI